jgi:type I restriction enzyme S subunit
MTKTTVGDFCPFIYGRHLPSGDRRQGPVPVYGSNGIIGWHDRALTNGPTVIIGRKGTVGQVRYSPVSCWPIDTTFYVEASAERDVRFVYFLLSALGLETMNSDSAVPGLNRDAAHSRSILVPRIAEQRVIADILGTLDDKIELNRQMNETLEAMARALFKSWFIDFDPVRAKTEGRDPGLPADIAALFPESFQGSDLGEIPKGWKGVPLPDVIEVNPVRGLRQGSVAPYLDMGNMPVRGHSPDVVRDRSYSSGMRFVNGDTLVARITPCLENGKTAYVDFLDDGQIGWGSTEYIVLRSKPPLPTEFGYCLARSDGFRDFAIQNMTGTSGRQRVATESLSHFLVVSPPRRVAELFGELVRPLFVRSGAVAKESRTLALLRDALLPRLMSGELRVPSD